MTKKMQQTWIKSGVFVLVTSLVFLVGLGGCADEADETDAMTASDSEGTEEHISLSGEPTENILKLFYHQSPTILNPHLTNTLTDLEAACVTYEPLASFNSEGDILDCGDM